MQFAASVCSPPFDAILALCSIKKDRPKLGVRYVCLGVWSGIVLVSAAISAGASAGVAVLPSARRAAASSVACLIIVFARSVVRFTLGLSMSVNRRRWQATDDADQAKR